MSILSYIFGFFVLAAALWAGMHTGDESPKVARKDWQIAGGIIAIFGAMGARVFFQ